jgi:hypothetical protein
MPNVPLDTRFIGIAADVNLTERKSAVINQQTAPYTMQDIVDTAGGGSYLKYVALLTQLGSNAPTAIVLENSLGGDITYDYTSQGTYTLILPIMYISGKLWFSATPNSNDSECIINYRDTFPSGAISDTMKIYTLEPTTAGYIDNALYNTSIEIRIYP